MYFEVATGSREGEWRERGSEGSRGEGVYSGGGRRSVKRERRSQSISFGSLVTRPN
jgi:hypothetical protein